jgi:tRNA pseudouridine55 synthase
VISGILPVDKPSGWTSHDVVARIRRMAGQKQVGHAGTLDPLATGVLVIVLGEATKLSSYLMESEKVYQADIVLGATTATDDAETPPTPRMDTSHLSDGVLRRAARTFVGEIDQIPPSYAAVRHRGEKLYTLARRGEEVHPEPRRVTVHAIDLLGWEPPLLRLQVRCGAGTYIRSLARDIGALLEVGGYLGALRRVASGRFTVECCARLDDLSGAAAITEHLYPPDHAVLDWPVAILDGETVRRVRNGQQVSWAVDSDSMPRIRLHDDSGTLIGLGSYDRGLIKPFRVFSQHTD